MTGIKWFRLLLRYLSDSGIYLTFDLNFRYFPYTSIEHADTDLADLMSHINKDKISQVSLYTTPLDKTQWTNLILYHAYAVFYTETSGGKFWWSLEKNGDALILQMSRNIEDVRDRIEGEERIRKRVYFIPAVLDWRPAVKMRDRSSRKFRDLYDDLIIDTDQLNKKYKYSDEKSKKFARIMFLKLAKSKKYRFMSP